MTLWFVLTVMIAVAAVLVSSPFIRRLERARLQSSGDLAVYRDQLREIASETALGLIDNAQAESASLEIKRRILAADRAGNPSNAPLSWQERRFAITAVTAIVIFGSIVLYAIVGSPDLPAATRQAAVEPSAVQPSTANSALKPASMQSAAQPQSATSSPPPATQTGAPPQTGLPPVEEMIQRLLTKLERNTQDPEGWRLLGWSYFSIERFADAANAYSKAIELRPASAEYRSARAEALIRGADGTVTPEARKDLDEAAKLDPKDSRARFFIGLAKEQAGDKAAAFADWNSLLADADPNEPWLSDLKQRVTDLRRDLGNDGATPPPAATPKASSPGLLETLRAADKKRPQGEPVARDPRPEDIRNAEKMAPEDRTAMIRGMVDGLASRLDQSPRDADGWIKLIRSRVVLGDAEQAKKSFQRALAVFTEDGPERTRIVEAAQQLGLNP
jgi:cytochrome c-type biogenesis protein CcmH